MSSQNTVHLIGNVAGVPDLKSYTKGDGTQGFRTWFRLAVCRNMDRGKPRDKQSTSFISVVSWGEAAKRHAQYIGKGDQISVYGELVCDSLKQQDGSYKEFTSVNAREIEYLRRSEKNQTPDQLQATATRLLGVMTALQGQVTADQGATGGTSVPTAQPTTGQDAFGAGGLPAGAVKVG